MYVLGPKRVFEAPVAILLKYERYEAAEAPDVKEAGVLWNSGEDGCTKTLCHNLSVCFVSSAAGPVVGCGVFGRVLLGVELGVLIAELSA